MGHSVPKPALHGRETAISLVASPQHPGTTSSGSRRQSFPHSTHSTPQTPPPIQTQPRRSQPSPSPYPTQNKPHPHVRPAPSAHATAGPSHIGKIPQPGATVINHIGNSPGFRIVLFDSRANTFQVFHCWQRPPDFHQDFRKRRSRSPTCSCVRNSPRSKAASPRFTASANRSSSSPLRLAHPRKRRPHQPASSENKNHSSHSGCTIPATYRSQPE